MRIRFIFLLIFMLGFVWGLRIGGAEDKPKGFHQSKVKPLTEEQIKKALEEPSDKMPHKLPGRSSAQKDASVKLCLACHQPTPQAPQELQIQEKESTPPAAK